MTFVHRLLDSFVRNPNPMPDPEGFTTGWANGIHAVAASATAVPGPFGFGTAMLLESLPIAPNTSTTFHRTNPTLGVFADVQTLSAFFKQPDADAARTVALAFRDEVTQKRFLAEFNWSDTGILVPGDKDDKLETRVERYGNGWCRALCSYRTNTGQGNGRQPALERPRESPTLAAIVNNVLTGAPRRMFVWNKDYDEDGLVNKGALAWGAMLEDNIDVNDAKPYMANASPVAGFDDVAICAIRNIPPSPYYGRVNVTDTGVAPGTAAFSITVRGRMGVGTPWVDLATITEADLVSGTAFADLPLMPQVQAWVTAIDADNILTVDIHE